MGEAAESDDWFIDQAVAEYEAYCAGELRPCVKPLEAPDGEVQYCGRIEDRSRWTVAYVRAADRVVTPLAVGDFEHVRAMFTRLDRLKARIEDPDLFPPPAALVGGVAHRFRAVQGCSLVGVVQVGKAAVLLAALGERLAAVYLEGKTRVVLDVKPPLGLRTVDVDRMLRFHRPATASAKAAETPVHPPTAIRAHHIRIVRGVPVDVGGGPSISEVLRGCFEDIVRRVRAQKQPGKKLKGKTKLRAVLAVLLRLGLLGCGDLVGLSGEIIAEIQEHVPEFEITAEAFADVLNLIKAAKCCLIERGDKERIWRINLVGLNDPRSELHVRLCKETTGCFRINEPAAANNQAAGRESDAGGSRPIGGTASTKAMDRHGRDRRAQPDPRGSTVDAEETAVAPEEAEEAPGAKVDTVEPSVGGGVGETVEIAPDGRGRDKSSARIEEAGSPGTKDSTPPTIRERVEDAEPVMSTTAASADPLAALGQLILSSPVMLVTTMVAIMQVNLEAEQARMAERVAWEAERDALRAQVEAVTVDRLTVSREPLVEVARLQGNLPRKTGQAEDDVAETRGDEADEGDGPPSGSGKAGPAGPPCGGPRLGSAWGSAAE